MKDQFTLFAEEKISVPGYENWLLVDGNNLMNRCYYATSASLSDDVVQPTNACSGFVKACLAYKDKFQANIVVFFDEGKGFRKRLYPPYKEGRSETPKHLKTQFPIIKDLLDWANIPYFWSEQVEADDLISSACNSLGGHKYVVSNDKDLLQVLSEDVSIIVRRGKNDVIMTPELFREEWEGLEPRQIVDFKALAGDSSDNLTGVAGIGDKGALKLIKHFQYIEQITVPFPSELKRYEKYFNGEGVKVAAFFKKLTTLVSSTPITLNKYDVNIERLINRCQYYDIKSLVTQLMKR
ncbi:MAG: 5'-3' exonuclease [Kurthia sp.]|nr:5'-3' exonuclease [Candidatus Kurthia equi]